MFGCIVAGRLVQTNLQTLSPTEYMFEIENPETVNHVVIFMLGTVPFNPGFGATVHFQWPNRDWQQLGFLTNEKPSAIYKLSQSSQPQNINGTVVKIGISVKPLQEIGQYEYQTQAQGKTVPIAEKILNNLINFTSSFAIEPNGPGNGSYIPLQTLQNWYQKTLDKLRLDPTYLTK